ncbi:MAG TPA: biopolymer transporter ExbD, partial [Pirellulales bacterium]
ASLLAARRNKPDIKMGDDLPTTVVIRADKSTRFNLLNNVIKECQDHGYRKFALKAMNKSD